jgi:hypothetical protein
VPLTVATAAKIGRDPVGHYLVLARSAVGFKTTLRSQQDAVPPCRLKSISSDAPDHSSRARFHHFLPTVLLYQTK